MKTCSWQHNITILIVLLLLSRLSSGQAVVVSEYFNSADVKDEWSELLVIADNTNLQGYSLRDNNTNQNNWQDSILFSSKSLWNNLRSGTIIVIWHRASSSSSIAHPIDTNKTDGYIEINAELSGYFSGLTSSSLTIAGGGDLVQLRNASGDHVHALGHKSVVGASYTALPTPKLNHSATAASDESIRVNPGANLAGYGGGSGTTLTNKSSSLISFGLPNKSNTDSTSNLTYWQSIRHPVYTSPTLNAIATNGAYSQHTLNWNACTDLNSTDSSIGYIILRNTINSFTNPSDGNTYSNGQTIGSATVAGHVSSSQVVQFIDNTSLNCGQTFYYKVYAYKFSADQRNGNAYHASRGRAYNESGTNVQSISRPQPIPITSIQAY